jgi:Fe-S cluster assembly ATP-binding protein
MNRDTEPVFACRDVHVFVGEKEIVKGVDLEVRAGEKHALMGPNGSGKSTLAAALMGHPSYRVTGEILLDGQPLHELAADARARLGLFLGFQYPVAVPGVSVANFLRAALTARRGAEIPIKQFRRELQRAFEALDVPRDFMGRYLNDGFSGGEKKRLEILQMLLLQPRFAVLDETDSGLDIDALKVVSDGINRAAGAATGVLLVTHYQRILNHVLPDRVHVFMHGRVVKTGGPELARELEERGYDWLEPAVATVAAAAGEGQS